MSRRLLFSYALPLLALGFAGCFYDSSWGQRKAMQKHEAERRTPAQLHARSLNRDTRVAERSMRLRVYATPTYSASVVHWQKQFADTLDCANSVFTPEFGVKFEVMEFVPFRPQASEDKLDGLLAELTAQDSGADVDWVVGLAAAVPRFAVSADDLGMAPLLGNHVVMRAMSDAHEYEAIQNELTELSEDARFKLYQVRKRHKLCAVFLHEIAHTLGVPHEIPEPSLMNMRYQVKAQGISREAASVMSAAFSMRRDQPTVFLEPGFAQTLESSMARPGNFWETKSRDNVLKEVARFRSSGASAFSATARAALPPPKPASTPAPSHTTATAAAPSPSTAGLSPSEQRSYDQARAELSAGRALAARSLAAPLLAKHADLPAVQSLRCEVAMAVGGDWETISAECQGLSPFSTPQ